MGCSKNGNLLDFKDVDVAWDTVGVSFQFFHLLLLLLLLLIIIILLSLIDFSMILNVFGFVVNKTHQTSRTLRRIPAVHTYKTVIFCNSTIPVLIPIVFRLPANQSKLRLGATYLPCWQSRGSTPRSFLQTLLVLWRSLPLD